MSVEGGDRFRYVEDPQPFPAPSMHKVIDNRADRVVATGTDELFMRSLAAVLTSHGDELDAHERALGAAEPF